MPKKINISELTQAQIRSEFRRRGLNASVVAQKLGVTRMAISKIVNKKMAASRLTAAINDLLTKTIILRRAEMQKIKNFLVSDSAEEFYPSQFADLETGLGYAIESFPDLFRRSLHDLKGKFSRGELMLLVDVFNSTMLSPQLSGQHIIAQVADGCDLDHLNEKWEIDKKTMLAKLKALPVFSLACLEVWANGFWYRQGAETFQSAEDLEKWVGQLLK